MPFDPHERARFLIDESRIAGISPDDTAWLRAHLTDCPACAHQEQITTRLLAAMDQLAFACSAGSQPAAPAPGRRSRRLSWPLAVAAALLLAVVPLYKSARDDARQSEADALLLERVSDQVSRTVPQAFEPLMQTGEPQ